jgi:hypothetical protein
VSWNVLWDHESRTQGMLQREDGSWATVTCGGDVIDFELPQRDAFVGPPKPPRMPDGLPTIEAMDQFLEAFQKWGES